MAKATKRKTVKRKVAKRKPVRKKVARKKVVRRKPVKKSAAKKRVVRKKPAKKKTAKKKTVAVRMVSPRRAIPEAARVAVSSIYEFNDELSWNIKKALDKYLRLVTKHTGYYKDVKRWTDVTIDKFVELGYELDAAHREYLKIAKRYLKKLGRL